MAIAKARAEGELARAGAGVEEAEALRPVEASLGDAAAILGDARAEAFGLLLEARRVGGWALLPTALMARLEQELDRRALLLRPVTGRLGPDDEAAIRWLERSLGLAPTGQPSLRLLEAVGIDPGPMFED
ncbi:hypothetical protein AKJ08_0770 [Vulgatibacter incomptus]|uniref:Uncharacterized protein n=2 Tax=Vulgatibacter incomptus TaxID=1391653 RepID=A0A0K1PA19_9BACT|nr:hypothetical protein AKJ08_0770 [Vulgatibacter incomptus]